MGSAGEFVRSLSIPAIQTHGLVYLERISVEPGRIGPQRPHSNVEPRKLVGGLCHSVRLL